MLENTEVLAQIIGLCRDEKTGTLFLSTRQNKACNIVFEAGRIIAMSYGPVKGAAVAEILNDLIIERGRFEENINLPLGSRAGIGPDTDIFGKLGFRRGDPADRKDSPPAASKPAGGERVYRGSEVGDSDPQALDNAARAVHKPKRIYRGQVVKD
ncbi:MAG: hypothetical protein LC637_02405 [Xanthomonadaceae bacterium]|nr:hypothetical protein [Xanthomonadaceae bacterium]